MVVTYKGLLILAICIAFITGGNLGLVLKDYEYTKKIPINSVIFTGVGVITLFLVFVLYNLLPLTTPLVTLL